MVRVSVKRNLAGDVVELRCRGHAGTDDGQGNDLVCAAVSALTGVLGLGLAEVQGWPAAVGAADGEFRLQLDDEQAAQARLLTESVVRGLEQMGQHYAGSVQVKTRRQENSG